MGKPVVGWKVGGIPPALRETLGERWTLGPIFAGTIVESQRSGNILPCIAGGFGAFEAELIVRVAADLNPNRTEFDTAYAESLIGAVFYGVEFAGSPLSGLPGIGPLASIASFGSNLGLCLCDPVESWDDQRLSGEQYYVTINGSLVGQSGLNERLLGQLAFACETSLKLGRPLKAGNYVTTGAITGVHQIEVGDRITLRIEGSEGVREHDFVATAMG